MAKALVAASIVWPLLLAGGTYARVRDQTPWWSAAVYLAGARICHQLPQRSFHTLGAQWPVCSRCSGLYLAAPLGALAATRFRRRSQGERLSLGWLALAALPTALTLALEHGLTVPLSPGLRFAAALPLGGAVSWVIVRVASGFAARIG